MNFISIAFCRAYQQTIRLASKFLNFREPQIFEGNDAVKNIPDILERYSRFHPLIVTDPGLKKLDLDKKITSVLKAKKVSFSIYSDVVPNPTFSCVEDGFKVYQEENCDCLIALGGGSSMDTAKAIAVKAIYPKENLSRFKGILKVRKKIPLLIAIPTTAGTGSEATCAAVVVNENDQDKFSINDPVIIPHFAILDNSFLENLPPKIIATTGMDALTHAIESFIGKSPSKLIRSTALEACALIKNNIYDFYCDSKNQTARKNMLKASYLAGVSFTRGYVGYVHALAHSLGGKYNVPHGLANAVLLPYVLEAYGKKAHKTLAMIADYMGLTFASQNNQEKAYTLISWIKEINKKMDIPEKILGVVKDEDVYEICHHAAKEGNPLYPVPKEMNEDELEIVLLLGTK